jgi:hypothetical protein
MIAVVAVMILQSPRAVVFVRHVLGAPGLRDGTTAPLPELLSVAMRTLAKALTTVWPAPELAFNSLGAGSLTWISGNPAAIVSL